MNEQVEKIYIDVLVNGYKIFVKKQHGNYFHVVTYYPYPPMMKLVQSGFPIEAALEQTSYHDYILDGDANEKEIGWEVKNNLIFSK